MEIYNTADIGHEADLNNPLEHGVIRYIPSDDCPRNIRNQLPSKNDRTFVYVPVGYLHREKDTFMDSILAALSLPLPNVIVVTPETAGSAEEQRTESYAISDAASHPVASDWSDEHCREVLAAKISALLKAVMDSSAEVGAWLVPDCPRRRNGSAQTICDALPTDGSCVALGLIGLDEEKEDLQFEARLREAMVPVGSPSKNAVRLSFDPNLVDGAPLPQLTHLLIFESPEEKKVFRNKLLDLVPDFMVAFGNVTKEAMNNIFENVKAGSPVVLIQHSGPNVVRMVKMFKHIHSHLSSNPDPTQKAKPIPALIGEEDELIKLFINTWPAGYNKEGIVLSDPLITTGAKLQKRLLGAISACFDLKTGSADAQAVRRKALDYAWAFYTTADEHSRQKKASSESLHVQFVVFTLLSIVASVFYNQIYGGRSGASKSAVQTIIYVSTILLPLYITSLKQETDKGTQMANWGAFKVASFRIHSEIFKFRTQSGRYRVEEKTEIALQKPVEAFTLKIKEIWMTLKPFLHEDNLLLPADFWNASSVSDLVKPDLSPPTNKLGSDFLGLPLDETTPILSLLPLPHSDPSVNSYTPRITEALPMEDFDDEDPPIIDFVDDKYSPLKADDYIFCRMQIEMQKKASQLDSMVKKNNRLGTAIKIITVLSGGFAALHFQWFVPIILAVTAGLGTAQEFRKYPHRIEQGNDMVMKLNEMKLWWMGLSMYEKQLPQNKDNLILTSEHLIVSELKSSYGGQSSKED